MIRISLLLLFLFSFTMSRSAAEPAERVPVRWRGGTGEFGEPDRWDPRGVPEPVTPIRIDGGSVRWREEELFMLSRSADTLIDGGTLHLSGSFRNGRDQTASLRLERGAVEHTGNFFVLGNSAPGVLVQEGGVLRSRVSRGFYFSDLQRSRGEYELKGGEVQILFRNTEPLQTTWQYLMGRAANDLWIIHGGEAVVDAGNERLPAEEEKTLFPVRSLFLGRSSRILLKDGSLRFNRPAELCVGYRTPGTAVIRLEGGTMEVNQALAHEGALVLGTASEGVLEVRGGSLRVSVLQPDSERNTGLILGRHGGFGMVDMRDGQIDLGDLDLVLAQDRDSVAQFNLAGGTLKAGNIRLGGEDSYGRFIFSGGEIILTGDRRAIVEEAFFTVRGELRSEYLPGSNQTRLRIRL